MTSRRLAVVCWVLVSALGAPVVLAENVRVLISPESGITVGDPVQVLLEAELEPAQTVVAPDWSQNWFPEGLEGVELVSVGSPAVENLEEQRIWRQLLTLRAFRPGEIQLPAPGVDVIRADAVEKRLDFGEIAWVVESVLPAGEEVDLQPPSPVRRHRLGGSFWLTGSLLGMLAAGSAVAAIAAGAFAAEPVRRPGRDPLSELRLALQKLDPRHPDQAHVALSSSLRRFLERRTGTPALERTTSEIYRDFGALAVGDGSRREVHSLLADCDLVKFGRFPADGGQLGDRVRRARAVAEEIETRLNAVESAKTGMQDRETRERT